MIIHSAHASHRDEAQLSAAARGLCNGRRQLRLRADLRHRRTSHNPFQHLAMHFPSPPPLHAAPRALAAATRSRARAVAALPPEPHLSLIPRPGLTPRSRRDTSALDVTAPSHLGRPQLALAVLEGLDEPHVIPVLDHVVGACAMREKAWKGRKPRSLPECVTKSHGSS